MSELRVTPTSVSWSAFTNNPTVFLLTSVNRHSLCHGLFSFKRKWDLVLTRDPVLAYEGVNFYKFRKLHLKERRIM